MKIKRLSGDFGDFYYYYKLVTLEKQALNKGVHSITHYSIRRFPRSFLTNPAIEIF